MLLSELDFSGQPSEPTLHTGPISFDGKVQYGGRSPVEEMAKLEAEEDEAFHKVLEARGLKHEEVGDNYPLPMSLAERSQVLQDMRSGKTKLRVWSDKLNKDVQNSIATKGILGDSDFALGSMPGSDIALYDDIVHMCLKDNIEFCIVYEGLWERIWFRVWRRNIDAAVARGKTIVVLTKEDASVGFNQSIEVAYLQRQGINFKTMRALHFALQRRPMLYAKDEVVEKLLMSHSLAIRPLLAQSSYEGLTALHVKNNTGLCEQMLNVGADVNLRSFNQVTPLMIAAQGSHVSKVELLLQHKADVNAADVGGRMALHLAASQAPTAEGVKLLLAQRANTSVLDNHYKATPLQWASYNQTAAKDAIIAALEGNE